MKTRPHVFHPPIAAFALLLPLAAILSCNLPQEPKAKTGTLSINLPGGDEARMTFQDYVDTLSFYLNGTGPAKLVEQQLNPGPNKLTIAPGSWTLTLSVKNPEGEVMGGDTKSVLVEAGKTSRVDFLIKLSNPNPEVYVITFDPNGGDAAPAPLNVPWKDAAKTPTLSSLSLKLPDPPAKSGFIFDGWHTAADGGARFTVDTQVSASLTLHAHWAPEAVSYTITFDKNGGESEADPATITVPQRTDNKPTTLKALGRELPKIPIKTDYVFAGWHTAPDGGAQFTIETEITASVMVYAHWTEKEYSYRITFDNNGGDTQANPQTLDIPWTVNDKTPTLRETGLSLPYPPEKTDYAFEGWQTAKNESAQFTEDTPASGNITVYAQWRRLRGSYTVKFNRNDGGAEANLHTIPVTWTENNETPTLRSLGINLPGDPGKTEHIFIGWFTVTGETKFDAYTPVSGDITVYARWIAPFIAQSVQEVADYLVDPDNVGTMENPLSLKVKMPLGDLSSPESAWRDLLSTLDHAMEHYVNLDISECTIEGEAFNHNNINNYGLQRIRKISLPTDITSIGANAFLNCTNLTDITLPPHLLSIGDYSFLGCTSLNLTELPNDITSIGANAFSGCSSLNLTELPNDITSIGANAFYYCTSLKLTKLPNRITSISAGAFQYCSNLKLTNLPSGITSIGASAFSGCSSLNLTELPNDITSIDASAFSGCYSLNLTELPNGITRISSSVFSGCTNLKLTELPNGITSIGNSAFLGCTNLIDMALPKSLTYIFDRAFDGCTSLATVTCNMEDPNQVSLYTDVFPSTITIYVPLKSVASYKTAAGWADYLSQIESIPFSSVEEISVYLQDPANVGTLANPLPLKVKTDLGNLSQTGSKWQNLLATLASAGDYVNLDISGCTIEGEAFNPTSLLSGIFFIKEINLPEGVASISNFAFSGYANLTAISLPDGLTSIGGAAFSGCTNLNLIEFPAGFNSIGSQAFFGCTNLTLIELPDSLASIGTQAFQDCTNLAEVICLSVTPPSIGDFAFAGISSQEIKVPSTSVDAYKTATGWSVYEIIAIP